MWRGLTAVAAAILATESLPAHAVTCRDPSISEIEWSRNGADRTLERTEDFDADGISDSLVVTVSSGSSGGGGRATATLSSGATHEVSIQYAFTRMTERDPIPSALLQPRLERLRQTVEDALFRRNCDAPDPSLARLLKPNAPLDWIDGPPLVPGSYTIVDRSGSHAVWLSYKGHTHAMNRPASAVPFPERMASSNAYNVYRTFHGVVVTDARETQHAWIYVFPGRHRKLRFPSVKDVKIEGLHVYIRLSQEKWIERSDTGGTFVEEIGDVRVHLASGKTTVRWRTAPR